MSVFHTNALAGASGRQGAGGGAAQYQIQRSLRFNSNDLVSLSRTPSVASNRTTWTWASWVKLDGRTTNCVLFESATDANNRSHIAIVSGNNLSVLNVVGGVTVTNVTLTRLFRDASAWYHIIVSATTSALSIYINGDLQTAFSTNIQPSGNNWNFNINAVNHRIGSAVQVSTPTLVGYLADVHWIDGQALTASSFGETDATTGEWIPKAYTGTYGTNGFKLDFADNSAATAAALGKDTSPNGNNFTPTNLSVVDTYNWSGYFQGVHYINVADNTALQMGTGNFTVEFWINFTSLTGYQTVIDKGYTFGGGLLLQTALNSGNLNVYLGGTQIFTTTGTVNVGQWYHYALVRSGTAVTMYRDGSSVGTGTSSANLNSTDIFYIGGSPNGGGFYTSAYISNVRLVKGTAVYTSGFTPPIKKLSAIAGTSLLTCQSSTFVDNSPNGFAISNSSVSVNTLSPFASPVGNDSMVDTPTSYGTDTGVGGEVRGNYCTLNPLDQFGTNTLSNGNLDVTLGTDGPYNLACGTVAITSGKWYWEVVAPTMTAGTMIGISRSTVPVSSRKYGDGNSRYYSQNGNKWSSASGVAYGASYTANDVVGVALDMDAGSLTYYKNGTSQGVAFTGLTGEWYPTVNNLGSGLTQAFVVNFGQRPFAYTAPSGFKALCDTNLPAPTIAKPSTVMDVKLYTGNSSTQTISGLGFGPDLVWIKSRSNGSDHYLCTTVQGTTKSLSSNNTAAEATDAGRLTAFNSDGFSLGSDGNTNLSGGTFAAWCWDAGSSTVVNSQGTLGGAIRANASAGFSIVQFVSPSAGNGTVGHGLGVAPSLIIAKNQVGNSNWTVYHSSATNISQYLVLNGTSAVTTLTNAWGNASPTSTVFGINSSNQGASITCIAYCFAPVAGYSAFGSYTGNGSADGPFVYTGFRPRWVMVKQTTTASATNWRIFDASRPGYNVTDLSLAPNSSISEGTTVTIDFCSNGFKLRNTSSDSNVSAGTYIYAAFAESPFQTSRAR